MIYRVRLSAFKHLLLSSEGGTYQTMTCLQAGSYPITTQIKTEGPVKRPVYQVEGLSI